MSITRENTKLADLQKEQCIALTTFRKSGRAVTTPVWFALNQGTMYVETHGDAGKLKRLRQNRRVTFAPCTYNGQVTGAVSEGQARILTEPEQCAAASTALSKKYGAMRGIFHFIRNVQRLLQRKPRVSVVYLAIEPVVDGL